MNVGAPGQPGSFYHGGSRSVYMTPGGGSGYIPHSGSVSVTAAVSGGSAFKNRLKNMLGEDSDDDLLTADIGAGSAPAAPAAPSKEDLKKLAMEKKKQAKLNAKK